MTYNIDIVATHDFENDSTLLDQIEKVLKKAGWEYSINSRPVREDESQ
jgi:hypothetical protein